MIKKEAAFKKFLFLAHSKTYAGTDEDRALTRCKKVKMLGHTEYSFSKDDWLYYDSYSGHIFPPGKEIVFYKNKPFWTMAYQGQFIENDLVKPDQSYAFLKEALRNTDENNPLRGPEKYEIEDWKYVFEKNGDWSYFIAKEQVFYKNKLVFFQNIMGSIFC
ncbi:MAG: DUF5680 domain-containing protein [Candidatus Moranbacteria bacterium]|nr:DUF5680 domain-containing protein [Candidatus Moranbacteria bacterium]